MKTLLILGGTGMVGRQLIEQALGHPSVERVVAPTRRPLPARDKLLNPIIDYETPQADPQWWQADAALCALGTTLRRAGSPQGFRRVDHDYVLAGARLALQAGTPTFVLNSSVGANPTSRSLYLKTKGKTEQHLTRLGFRSLTLVRPSLLDAGKRPDWRPGETAGLWLARRFAPLIPSRYQAVSAEDVAACMLSAALIAPPGVHQIESESIPVLSDKVQKTG